MLQLMKHQEEALDFLQGRKRAGLFLTMGLGKSVIMLEHLNRLIKSSEQVFPCLIVAPLSGVGVWENEVKKFNYPFKTVKLTGTYRQRVNALAIPADIYLINYEGLRILERHLIEKKFKTLVCDECFVGNTLIKIPDGYATIDSIEVGDIVCNAIGSGKVRHIFKKKVTRLIKITTDYDSVICTPDHPFFTDKGWVLACNLNQSHSIVRYDQTMQMVWQGLRDPELGTINKNEQVLQSSMCQQREPTFEDQKTSRNANKEMQMVWEEFQFSELERVKKNQIFLQQELLREMENQPACLANSSEEQRARYKNFKGNKISVQERPNLCDEIIQEDDGKQPYENEGSQGESIGNIKKDRASPQDKRRQWDGANKYGKDSAQIFSKVYLELSNIFRPLSKRLSNLLQDRFGLSSIKISGRDRWFKPQLFGTTDTRPQKGKQTGRARVVSCENIEQEDLERFGFSSEGVEVFNLEVEGHPSYIVGGYDELVVHNCHRLSNRGTQQTKVATLLSQYLLYCYLLTGTPICKSPEDVWSQFQLIAPNYLGNFYAFQARHVEFKKINIKVKGGGYREIRKPVRFKYLEELNQKLQAYSIRRTKEECLDLPEKIFKKIPCPLTPEQQKHYHGLKHCLATMIGEEQLKLNSMVQVMQKLQQVTQGFMYLENKVEEFPSGKQQIFFDLMEDLVNEKVVVFTWFTYDTQMLCKKLAEKGYKVLQYDGGFDERKRIVDEFQTCKEPCVFVSNVERAKESITLTAANQVIYYGNSWNYATRVQSLDRCLDKKSLVFYSYSGKVRDMGLKQIQNIKVGEYVLTHTGSMQKVLDVSSKNHRGLMTEIKYMGWPEPLVCTSDHKIFVNRNDKLVWLEAHQVLPTDLMVFPKIKKSIRLDSITIEDDCRLHKNIISKEHCDLCNEIIYARDLCKKHYRELLKQKDRPPKPKYIGMKYVRLPDKIKIDNKWLYIFGYYVANGFSSINDGKSKFVSIASHIKNKALLEKIGDKFLTYGIKYNIYSGSENGIEMRCYSTELALLFRKLFGHGAKNKTLPSIIMDLPPDQASVFLKGYIDGDGYQRKRQVEWVTASEILSYQMCLLAIKSGFIPTMRRGSVKSGSHYVGGFTKFSKLKNNIQKQDENYIYRPVRSVTTYKDKTIVYDITVDKDHSFTSGFSTVHNCHRIGQKRSVNYYDLVVPQTIDELIYDSLQYKGDVAGKITGDAKRMAEMILQQGEE